MRPSATTSLRTPSWANKREHHLRRPRRTDQPHRLRMTRRRRRGHGRMHRGTLLVQLQVPARGWFWSETAPMSGHPIAFLVFLGEDLGLPATAVHCRHTPMLWVSMGSPRSPRRPGWFFCRSHGWAVGDLRHGARAVSVDCTRPFTQDVELGLLQIKTHSLRTVSTPVRRSHAQVSQGYHGSTIKELRPSLARRARPRHSTGLAPPRWRSGCARGDARERAGSARCVGLR